MNEKIYKCMRNVGIWNVVVGIILIVVGLGSGVLTIINGAKLIKDKSEIMF